MNLHYPKTLFKSPIWKGIRELFRLDPGFQSPIWKRYFSNPDFKNLIWKYVPLDPRRLVECGVALDQKVTMVPDGKLPIDEYMSVAKDPLGRHMIEYIRPHFLFRDRPRSIYASYSPEMAEFIEGIKIRNTIIAKNIVKSAVCAVVGLFVLNELFNFKKYFSDPQRNCQHGYDERHDGPIKVR